MVHEKNTLRDTRNKWIILHTIIIIQVRVNLFHKNANFRPHSTLVEKHHVLNSVVDQTFKHWLVKVIILLQVVCIHTWSELLMVSNKDKMLSLRSQRCRDVWFKNLPCFFYHNDLVFKFLQQWMKFCGTCCCHCDNIGLLKNLDAF